ncbi:hypothetical protein BD410DRAFT_843108 [Rickenella mellea]|uniref:Helicase ATP-binding domain-containing protein n=1 Tax=Rickenella mellea TaxID=50990 RepID=A0A4Y7PRR2_9AGAM|nr:hypothetical protein BD410DRAFT_843108 [Rickenella mellea]
MQVFGPVLPPGWTSKSVSAKSPLSGLNDDMKIALFEALSVTVVRGSSDTADYRYIEMGWFDAPFPSIDNPHHAVWFGPRSTEVSEIATAPWYHFCDDEPRAKQIFWAEHFQGWVPLLIKNQIRELGSIKAANTRRFDDVFKQCYALVVEVHPKLAQDGGCQDRQMRVCTALQQSGVFDHNHEKDILEAMACGEPLLAERYRRLKNHKMHEGTHCSGTNALEDADARKDKEALAIYTPCQSSNVVQTSDKMELGMVQMEPAAAIMSDDRKKSIVELGVSKGISVDYDPNPDYKRHSALDTLIPYTSSDINSGRVEHNANCSPITYPDVEKLGALSTYSRLAKRIDVLDGEFSSIDAPSTGRSKLLGWTGTVKKNWRFGKTIQAIGVIVSNEAPKCYEGISATLVICPKSILTQWEDEIEKFAPYLEVKRHHEPSKCRSPNEFKYASVVLATYDTLTAEHGAFLAADDDKKDQASCPLFGYRWFRVILDEAHIIRNPNSKRSLAARALKKLFGHCLSGTPAQNYINDLFPIFNFIGAHPYDDWDQFKPLIAAPVKAGHWFLPFKPVLAERMLRRTMETKINGELILTLPDRHESLIRCDMTPLQLNFYHFVDEHAGLHPLPRQIRRRQVCDHPALMRQIIDKDDVGCGLLQNAECQPVISYPDTGDGDGITGYDLPYLCEHCNEHAPDPSTCNGLSDLANMAGKVQMIFSLLAKIRSRSEYEMPRKPEKVLIVSLFASMLDLLHEPLKRRGILFERFDGRLDVAQRQQALRRVRDDPSVTVLLLSLMAGGTGKSCPPKLTVPILTVLTIGLNITSCNHLILIEPWWNPYVEDQAFGRIHRIGQERDVHIYRLYCPDTIEEYMLKVQEKKRELVSGVFAGSSKDMEVNVTDINI